VTEATEDQALLVPQQAVIRDADGQPVAYVVGHEDKLERRALSLGRAIGDRWVVNRGLASGERLVVDGAQKATPGALVLAMPIVSSPSIASAPPPGSASAQVRVARASLDRAPIDGLRAE
jgi:membrane fusion protein (multidrug efflux system)